MQGMSSRRVCGGGLVHVCAALLLFSFASLAMSDASDLGGCHVAAVEQMYAVAGPDTVALRLGSDWHAASPSPSAAQDACSWFGTRNTKACTLVQLCPCTKCAPGSVVHVGCGGEVYESGGWVLPSGDAVCARSVLVTPASVWQCTMLPSAVFF